MRWKETNKTTFGENSNSFPSVKLQEAYARVLQAIHHISTQDVGLPPRYFLYSILVEKRVLKRKSVCYIVYMLA